MNLRPDDHLEPVKKKWTVSYEEEQVGIKHGCYLSLTPLGHYTVDDLLINIEGVIIRRGNIHWLKAEAKKLGIAILPIR